MKGGENVAVKVNLGALLERQKAIVLGEKRAMEQLNRARAEKAKFSRSVADTLYKELKEIGCEVGDLPFILGAVLEAKSQNNRDYFEDLGNEYLSGGAKAAAEEAPAAGGEQN